MMTTSRSIWLLAWALIAACHARAPRPGAKASALAHLEASGDVFALRDRLAARPDVAGPELAFYRAVVAHAFNRPAESRAAAAAFLASHPADHDRRARRARELIATALVREGRYGAAATAIEDVLAHHAQELDARQLANHRNDLAIWRALRDAPVQTVSATAASHLAMHRDVANLLRVSAVIGAVTTEVVVDTGANLSVVTRSLAGRAGLAIIDANIQVDALTGTTVPADLAVVPEIVLGNHRVRNVVVLVFDDAALAFPTASYAIDGILGFPVLEALGELRLHGDRELELPTAPTPRTAGNLALSDLKLLVQIHHRTDALVARLDTGAGSIALLTPWFTRYRAEIEAARYPRRAFSLGGAGGVRTLQGYLVPSVTLRIADHEVTLRDVQLLTEHVATDDDAVANLGQDLLQQFGTVIIDFASMALELAGPAS
jgi:predicted aspartyl protease